MATAAIASGVFQHIVPDGSSAASLADFRRVLLGNLARLVGADTASMMDPPGADTGNAHERTAGFGIGRDVLERFLALRHRYDRSLARMVRAMRAGGPVIDADVYTSRDRRELAVYRELFRPQGATSVLGAEVRGRSTLVVFKRRGRASPFRSRDAAMLEALLPVITLADAGCGWCLEARRPGPLYGRHLTVREAQVASLASRGMRNAEIAALLGTSVETTKKQLKSVFAKAEVSNRTELAMIWAAEAAASPHLDRAHRTQP